MKIGIVINIRAAHDLDLRFHSKAFHFLLILGILFFRELDLPRIFLAKLH